LKQRPHQMVQVMHTMPALDVRRHEPVDLAVLGPRALDLGLLEALRSAGANGKRVPVILLTEEDPAQQSGLLRAILDSIADAVVVVGDTGQVLFCNRAAGQLLDLHPEENVSDWLLRHEAR